MESGTAFEAGHTAGSRRRGLLWVLGVALVAAALVAPTAAQAVSWGTLKAYYGTDLRATGYGNFTNDRNINAKQTATFRTDTSNYAYTITHVKYWQYSSTTKETTWQHKGSISLQTTSKSLVTKSGTTPLSSIGSRARGNTQVCEQTPWYNPDVCSPWAYPTFDY